MIEVRGEIATEPTALLLLGRAWLSRVEVQDDRILSQSRATLEEQPASGRA
jgi:hypothetical protein